jgi:putative sterol carrier protein
MADITPKSIIEENMAQRLQANPGLAKEMNAVIQFQIDGPTGGTWTVDLTAEKDWIKAGAVGTPKMTVVCTDADFVKIVKKELNAQMAAMQGKLKFKPMDMGLAMKLGKLLA